jgi:hypothetical protein
LTGDLKIYFPHMLDWFERLDTELVCALLERWPTLEELQKVPPAQLRTFLHKHHCRDQELIERRILAIRKAIPAIRDRAVIEAKGMVVKVIVQVLLADAYGVVAGNAIARAGCWSHYARRKFVDAEKTAPEIAREVVALLRTLFAIEKQAREASASERLEIRQKRPPVIRDTRQAEFPERPPRGVTVRRGDVLNQRKPQSGIPHP